MPHAHILNLRANLLGQDSVVVDIASCQWSGCTQDHIVEGCKVFCTHPDWPWGQPSLLYNGYRVSFAGVSRQGCGIDHPPPSSAEVNERIQLYLCSPSWAFMVCCMKNVIFTLPLSANLQLHHCHLIISQFLQSHVMYLVLCVYLSHHLVREWKCVTMLL